MAVSSANRTGHPASRTVVEAASQLGAAVEFYLDGGPVTGGLASTIVDCTRDEPVFLRVGAIVRGRRHGRRRARPGRRPRVDAVGPEQARRAEATEPAEQPTRAPEPAEATSRTARRPTRPPPSSSERPPTMTDTFYGSDFGALEAFDPDIAGVLALRARPPARRPPAHRERELLQPRGAHRARARRCRTSTPRATPGVATTAAAARSTRPRRSPSSAARRSSGPTTPTSRRTPGPAPTRPSTAPSSSPGEKILAMSLPHGGHLTHGTKVSFSGKWFDAVHYGVDKDTEDIDYDQVEQLAREHRPKVILAGGSAIPRLIDFERFRAIADEVGAIFWVDAAHFIGLVAGKAIPSPVPYADVVSFTTHKVLRGPRSRRHRLQGRARGRHRQGGLPDDAGRPADARDRGEGGQLQGVRDARVRRLHPPGRRQRQGPGRVARRARASARRPAAPTPTCRCTTSSRSWSPGSTPRRAATRPASP